MFDSARAHVIMAAVLTCAQSIAAVALATRGFMEPLRVVCALRGSCSGNWQSNGDDLLLANVALAGISLVSIAALALAPLIVVKYTQRRFLEATILTLASAIEAYALARVITNPLLDSLSWGSSFLLLACCVLHAALMSCSLRRTYDWAAYAAARKLGVRQDIRARPLRCTPSIPLGGAGLRRLIALSIPDVHYNVLGFVCFVLAAAISTTLPGLIGRIIDAIDQDDANGKAARTELLLQLVGVTIGAALFTGLRSWAFTIALARLQIRLRDRLFRALLTQEQEFFDVSSVSDLLRCLASDTTVVGAKVSRNVNDFLRSVITALGSVAFMFSLSTRLTALSLCVVPATVLANRVYGAFEQRQTRRAQRQLAACNALAEEVLSAADTVHSFGSENEEADRHADLCGDYYVLNKVQANATGTHALLTTATPGLLTALMLYVGGELVAGELTSSGVLVSFLLYQSTLSVALSTIGDVWSGTAVAARAAEKVQYARKHDNVPSLPRTASLSRPFLYNAPPLHALSSNTPDI